MVVHTELAHVSTTIEAKEKLMISLGSPRIQWGELPCGDYSLLQTFSGGTKGELTLPPYAFWFVYVHGTNVLLA